jgi:hypothetical protein
MGKYTKKRGVFVKRKIITLLVVAAMLISCVSGICFGATSISFTVNPAVFMASKHYNIVWKTNTKGVGYVEYTYNSTRYRVYDEEAGVVRTDDTIHTVSVPKDHLDAAGGYTVHIRPVIRRSGWCSQTGEVYSYPYPFFSVPATNARAYCISDAHGRVAEPVAAAKAYGDMDFLILNGDLNDCCDDPAVLLNIYHLCS